MQRILLIFLGNIIGDQKAPKRKDQTDRLIPVVTQSVCKGIIFMPHRSVTLSSKQQDPPPQTQGFFLVSHLLFAQIHRHHGAMYFWCSLQDAWCTCIVSSCFPADTIKYHGGTVAENNLLILGKDAQGKRTLAITLIRSADPTRYGTLITKLSNQYVMGIILPTTQRFGC